MRELHALLSGQNAGDHYTFLCALRHPLLSCHQLNPFPVAGHASQSPSDDEEDGQDERQSTWLRPISRLTVTQKSSHPTARPFLMMSVILLEGCQERFALQFANNLVGPA